jgi:hypothetical protein
VIEHDSDARNVTVSGDGQLNNVKDFVSKVPSITTAVLPGCGELIAQGPMMNGSAVVPEPLTTQLHA